MAKSKVETKSQPKLRKYKMLPKVGTHWEPIFDETGKIIGETEHSWDKNPIVETSRDLMKAAVGKFERYFGSEEDEDEEVQTEEAEVETTEDEEDSEEDEVTESKDDTEEEETLSDHTGQDEEQSTVKPKVKKVVKKVAKKK